MIYISAGHHKTAQGAKYEVPGEGVITEFMLTTAWQHHLCQILGGSCVKVPSGTLKEKTNYINYMIGDDKNNLAIEIHFNSFKLWKDLNANGVIDDNEMINAGRGSETLYLPGSKTGKLAAEIMQDALGQIYPPNRGAKEGWYKMNPANDPDWFLAAIHCTTLIIEPEFIDNTDTLRDKMDSACHVIANTLLEIEQELFKND